MKFNIRTQFTERVEELQRFCGEGTRHRPKGVRCTLFSDQCTHLKSLFDRKEKDEFHCGIYV